MNRPRFEQSLADVRDVPGWLHDEQARRLWDAATAVRPGGQIIEIGAYQGRATIVLARAASVDTEVISIDPHAGVGRSPGKWEGSREEGLSDHVAFKRNLSAQGVENCVRHVCAASADPESHAAVVGQVDLLYVDGSHSYGDVLSDLRGWGSRVRPGGTMLVHDTYGSFFVTAATYRSIAFSPEWRYAGRERSLVEYRHEPVRGLARFTNVARQLSAFPWFARNMAVKSLTALRLERLASVFGHRPGDSVF